MLSNKMNQLSTIFYDRFFWAAKSRFGEDLIIKKLIIDEYDGYLWALVPLLCHCTVKQLLVRMIQRMSDKQIALPPTIFQICKYHIIESVNWFCMQTLLKSSKTYTKYFCSSLNGFALSGILFVMECDSYKEITACITLIEFVLYSKYFAFDKNKNVINLDLEIVDLLDRVRQCDLFENESLPETRNEETTLSQQNSDTFSSIYDDQLNNSKLKTCRLMLTDDIEYKDWYIDIKYNESDSIMLAITSKLDFVYALSIEEISNTRITNKRYDL